MKTCVLVVTALSCSFALASKWDRSNNPTIFNPIVKVKMNPILSELPLKAELTDHRLAWSETYWPSNLGGIAYRWNSPNPQPFTYKLLTKEEVLKLSEAQLSELSPSELYDIAMGDYKYSLTKKVLSKYNKNDLWWEGICHGWALAATNYPEPSQTVVSNPDGVKVPFGASDVKGLLSMHDAYNSKGYYVRVGDRCRAVGKVAGEAFPEDGDIAPPSKKAADKSNCEDVNAGAFHIIIASMIGLNSKGFVADVDRFNDVWNQPVSGYESEIVEEVSLTNKHRKDGIDKKIRVKTNMSYGDELEFYSAEEASKGVLGFVSKEPVTETPAQVTSVRKYEYILELDRYGKIVGGEWISESRPDMVWSKAPDASFLNGDLPLAGLNKIYKPMK